MTTHEVPPQPPRCLARSWLTTLAVLMALLVPYSARGQDGRTFYVRGCTGVDAHGGLSPDDAVCTIGKAAGLANKPGDRIVVAPGTYQEGDLPNGTPGQQI